MPGFIASQIARINRNYLLVALLLAAVAGAIVYFGWTYVAGVVLGPRVVSAEELGSSRFQSDAASYKRIVTVRGSEVRSWFYKARVPRGKHYGTLYCWLLKVGDAQVMVEGWEPSASLSATGELRPAPQNILNAASAYRKAGAILPVLVDTRDWRTNGWTLVVFGSLAGAGALGIAGTLLWWNSHPDRHPVRRAVARLGDFDAIALQVDGEMQAAAQSFGPVRLGQTMLAYARAFAFDLTRVDGILSARAEWLRKGKTTALYLLMETREGRTVKWEISRKYANELLNAISTAAHIEVAAVEAPKILQLRIGRKG